MDRHLQRIGLGDGSAGTDPEANPQLHQDVSGRYSWWSYRAGARKRNIGWRIDYFCISSALKDRVANANILDEVEGSDHCPVLLEL